MKQNCDLSAGSNTNLFTYAVLLVELEEAKDDDDDGVVKKEK